MNFDHYKAANEASSGPSQECRSFFHVIEQFGILKTFQKNLYLLTGLPFDFVDLRLRQSENLRAHRVFTPFCTLVKSSPLGHSACECDERQIVANCVIKLKSVVRCCHLGLIEIVVPVVMNNGIVGLLCTGQMLYQRPTEKNFKKIQKRLAGMGVDVTKARQAYFSAPVIEKRRVAAIIDLIQMVVELIDAGRLQTLKSAVMHDPTRKALDFIEAHYADPVTLTVVAKEAGLSVSRLAHVFKAQTGMSFTAYLNLIRINWAKYYLTNSHVRVSETAFQVGFGNLSHFNHVFRQATGLSPTQYRHQHASTRI
ncbi:MAG: PocR ligand-binding domain-containing protein [Verrucomicrobiota bacterium]